MFSTKKKKNTKIKLFAGVKRNQETMAVPKGVYFWPVAAQVLPERPCSLDRDRGQVADFEVQRRIG